MITFKCLKCDAECSVEDSLAGEKHECSSCGNVHIVPGPAAEEKCAATDEQIKEPPVANPCCMSDGDKLWSLGSHLGIFIAGTIPFANILLPLLVLCIKKDTMPQLAMDARKAINFQLSMTIYTAVAALTFFIFIGMFLVPALIIFNMVYSILTAVKVSKCEDFEYPITIKFIDE